jgi:hypothetical protein
LFIREEGKLVKNHLQNKKTIPTKNLYNYNLFLSHAAAFDITGDCKKITDYFGSYSTSDYEFNHKKFRWLSLYALEQEKLKKKFIKLLNSFNINIDEIEVEE